MPSLRRLLARKFMPGLQYGHVGAEDLGPNAITPDALDRKYVEAGFGGDATGVRRQIERIWIADDEFFAESTDEF